MITKRVGNGIPKRNTFTLVVTCALIVVNNFEKGKAVFLLMSVVKPKSKK